MAGEGMGKFERAWCQLLADLWENEDHDGGWPGGDTVDILCQTFERLGMNIEHPAMRLETVAHDRDDYGDAELLRVAMGDDPDLRCVRCHSVIKDPAAVAGIPPEHALCAECGDPE